MTTEDINITLAMGWSFVLFYAIWIYWIDIILYIGNKLLCRHIKKSKERIGCSICNKKENLIIKDDIKKEIQVLQFYITHTKCKWN